MTLTSVGQPGFEHGSCRNNVHIVRHLVLQNTFHKSCAVCVLCCGFCIMQVGKDSDLEGAVGAKGDPGLGWVWVQVEISPCGCNMKC
jgi:hypothetical protein